VNPIHTAEADATETRQVLSCLAWRRELAVRIMLTVSVCAWCVWREPLALGAPSCAINNSGERARAQRAPLDWLCPCNQLVVPASVEMTTTQMMKRW